MPTPPPRPRKRLCTAASKLKPSISAPTNLKMVKNLLLTTTLRLNQPKSTSNDEPYPQLERVEALRHWWAKLSEKARQISYFSEAVSAILPNILILIMTSPTDPQDPPSSNPPQQLIYINDPTHKFDSSLPQLPTTTEATSAPPLQTTIFPILALARELRDMILLQIVLAAEKTTRSSSALPAIAYTTPQLFFETLPLFLTHTLLVFRTAQDIATFILGTDSLSPALNPWTRIRKLKFKVLPIALGGHISDIWSLCSFAPGVQEITLVFELAHLIFPAGMPPWGVTPGIVAALGQGTFRSAGTVMGDFWLHRLFSMRSLAKVTLVCRWPAPGDVLHSPSARKVFWDLREALREGFRGARGVREVRVGGMVDEALVKGRFVLEVVMGR
ncbi:hypothetical protein CC80DRAFT_544317 [Byssothecium circinans]|uniref:Uncharacterized protein n=1 Tax=Byssothecium circinans TaxID=147558 RepID=A0A6A5U9B7_9PLEO|nr:hypothetical protein CC80DRAFT_544317 [Byssothecium circinans]